MKITFFIRAVVLFSNIYILVNGRSLKKVQDKDVNILSDEDRDSDSATKFLSQMSFIEEFLSLASPSEDGEMSIQPKVVKKEEKMEVNERHDKIFWTDDELYQLKLSHNKESKQSPVKPSLQQDNSEASKNLFHSYI